MTSPTTSLLPLRQDPIGQVPHGDLTFTLKVTRFDGYERLRPIIAWVWLDEMMLGYLGGLTCPEGGLTFWTQAGVPVDRTLIWPEEDDVEMFAHFRKLWTAAGYGGAAPDAASSEDEVAWLGEFQLFGTTYTAWRNPDVPSTIRFALDGTELGKLVGIGSHPRLRLHRAEWPPYRRNAMRVALLDLLAAQDRSP